MAIYLVLAQPNNFSFQILNIKFDLEICIFFLIEKNLKAFTSHKYGRILTF